MRMASYKPPQHTVQCTITFRICWAMQVHKNGKIQKMMQHQSKLLDLYIAPINLLTDILCTNLIKTISNDWNYPIYVLQAGAFLAGPFFVLFEACLCKNIVFGSHTRPHTKSHAYPIPSQSVNPILDPRPIRTYWGPACPHMIRVPLVVARLVVERSPRGRAFFILKKQFLQYIY